MKRYAIVYLTEGGSAKLLTVDAIDKGESYTKAIAVASRYYDANPDDVRHFVSQRSGRKQANKKSAKY